MRESKSEKLVVFLPCRAGSQRVKNKNTKKFSNYSGGLLQKKLETLSSIVELSKIVVSTNDDEVLTIAEQFREVDNRIEVDLRPNELCSSDTTTDALISYVSDKIDADHILWTHVTSPFLEAEHYKLIIERYWLCLSQGYDSLMTVKSLKTFLWSDDGPVNYDRDDLKWPMTQNLPVYYEIDSGVFLASKDIYTQKNDRIGNDVYLYPNDGLQSLDIDWEDDFTLAEQIQNSLTVLKKND